eukprot:883673-Pyramimonas_sp.AAC.1
MESKKHFVGPIRVSLSNRLPLLERNLLREPGLINALVDQFDVARKIKQLPNVLNFEGRPLIVALPKDVHSTAMQPVVAAIFYHCDLENTYRAMKVHQRHDSKIKDKKHRTEDKLTDTRKHTGVDTILSLAISDHFRQVHDAETFYSIPAAAASNLQSMSQWMDKSGIQVAQERRAAAMVAGALAIEDEPDASRDLVFKAL